MVWRLSIQRGMANAGPRPLRPMLPPSFSALPTLDTPRLRRVCIAAHLAEVAFRQCLEGMQAHPEWFKVKVKVVPSESEDSIAKEPFWA